MKKLIVIICILLIIFISLLIYRKSEQNRNITAQEVDIFISNFLSYGMISEKEAKLLKVATSDKVLKVPQNLKDSLRASIFKNMLLNLVED